MDDIAEQLALRDRFMRHRWEQLTPEERVEQMFQLQARSWELLRSSPTGYAAFLKRNFRARAIDFREPDVHPDTSDESVGQ